MRALIAIGTLIFIMALIGLAWSFANFWYVFLVPAFVLFVTQFVGLSTASQDRKDKFFGITDYIYYIGIGAIVGLASQFLTDIDEVLRYDSEVNYHRAIKELPQVSGRLESALASAEKGNSLISETDERVIFRCIDERFRLAAKGDDRERPVNPIPFDVPAGCELVLGTFDSWTQSIHDVKVLSARKTRLEEAISAGPEGSGESQVLSEGTIFWLLHQLFPMLFLCGVSLKIGKTTNTILK